ncbi:M-phase phosphoprotein 9 [Plakobranchus ocellatus]|uniref:M-phase phosphoprotein 9 n=1 Tax=Plakobranchus ocellatus TaxID=259542 RepID=A0AAV4CAA4_9GAST|nr:M-phase phosphoprotein 9 [Plakobranchus ocellatus]
MNSGDGGAEEEFRDKALSSNDEQADSQRDATDAEEVLASIEKEAALEASSGHGDTADGSHSDTLQDEDGDSPGVRDKAEGGNGVACDGEEDNAEGKDASEDTESSIQVMAPKDTSDSPGDFQGTNETETERITVSAPQVEVTKMEGYVCLLEDKDSGEVETCKMPSTVVEPQGSPMESSQSPSNAQEADNEVSNLAEPGLPLEIGEGDGTVASGQQGHQVLLHGDQFNGQVEHTSLSSELKKVALSEEKLTHGGRGTSDLVSDDHKNQLDQEKVVQTSSGVQEQQKPEAEGEAQLASSSGFSAELDDFFASGASKQISDQGPGKVDESHAAKVEEEPSNGQSQTRFFPALDNVDLETDEELLEVEKVEEVTPKNVGTEAQKIGEEFDDEYQEKSTQLSNTPDDIAEAYRPTESPERADFFVKTPIPENSGYSDYSTQHQQQGDTLGRREFSGETTRNIELPGHISASNREEERLPATVTKPALVYPNNYEVCRELQPGVKECLVLETGEQFIYVNSPSDGLGVEPKDREKGSSVYLVQTNGSGDLPFGGASIRLESPFNVSAEEDTTTTPQLYRTTHPTTLRVDHVLSPSEAFAYMSFDDGENIEEHGRISANYSKDFPLGKSLDGKQQAYINQNGIPIIMDNAEVDVKTQPQRDLVKPSRDSEGSSGDAEAKDRLRRYLELHGQWAGNGPFMFAQSEEGSNVINVGRSVENGTGLQASSTEKRFREMNTDSGDEYYLWKKKKTKTKRSRAKEDHEEMIELEPDEVTDNSDGGGSMPRPCAAAEASPSVGMEQPSLNTNNNNISQGEEEEEDEDDRALDKNNSAGDRLSVEPQGGSDSKSRSKKGSSKSVQSTSARSHPDQSYREYDSYGTRRSDTHSYYSRSSRHSPSRSSYLHSSRDSRSRDESSLLRSGESGYVDPSRLSTRYMHLDRGDSHSTASRSESSTVPRFNTLHDQQMSWLDMFKMIEAQHRTELRSQHEQHERLLQELQQNMARELSKQQDTLKHSLSAHREILEELSPGRHRELRQNKNQSRQLDEVERSSVDSQRSAESGTQQSSHTTLQGVDVSLRNPPPFSGYNDLFESRDFDDVPVKQSLERKMGSPSRPADTSLGQSRVSVGRDKQLRGGVYSSPMPLAKSKHKNSPRATKSSSDATVSSSPRDDKSRNANSARKLQDEAKHDRLGEAFSAPADASQAESDDFLSPRTRISLREKHARHLADLRAYYEEELRELRQTLQATQRKLERGGGDGGSGSQNQQVLPPPGRSMEEKILAKENDELRQRCRELQDEYHDPKSEIRELQQKIQGLEIRAADYAERYDQSQSQVLSLGSRLEELTEFAKEKECTSTELEAKNKRVAESLQLAYKKEKELTESLHNAKTTIQRLVDKYEILEKDFTLLKESSAVNHEKLLNSRHDAMEANNKLSRLEMDNKQLQHDNEILKHELTMARNSLSMRTSYEDSYSPSRSREQGRTNHSMSTSVRSGSRDRAQHNSSPTTVRKSHPRALSPEESRSDSPEDLMRSPILRAEQELRKLQGSSSMSSSRASGRDFTPKLQHKFYGTEVSSKRGASPANRFSPTSKSRSPSEKKGQPGLKGRDSGNNRNASRLSTKPSQQSSKAEPINFITERERSTQDSNLKSSEKKFREKIEKDQKSSLRKPTVATNGMSGELAMERIKSGDIVSRPDWEDMYTSMVPSRPGYSEVDRNLDRTTARDKVLQERVRNIDNLEKKYDHLVKEKRKYESSLSKLPLHGHRGEKERLEMELDRLDKELGSVRMSLKRFHVLKSTI